MPPAVCRDSEDEDEDFVEDEEVSPSQQSPMTWAAKQAEQSLAIFPDTTIELQPPGTTSSDLFRDIVEAQRGFFNTAPNNAPAATNPELQHNKRRNTMITEARNAATSPAKGVKRAKTAVQTYGSKSSTTMPPSDDDRWKAFLDDDGVSTNGLNAAGGTMDPGEFELPIGTIQQDFLDHEPTVMFQDTGTTNPFNESSEQRLMDQVNHTSTVDPSHLMLNKAVESESQRSSSFPWSASVGPTPSSKSNASRGQLEKQNAMQHQSPGKVPHEQTSKERSQPSNEKKRTSDGPASDVEKAETAEKSHHFPRSSPFVEIPRHTTATTATPGVVPPEAPKSSKGRKRKSQEAAEGLPDWDDPAAIGLPAENYVPKPSRRRATGIPLAEPTDYSKIPGKSANKRRKSAGSTVSTEMTKGVELTDATSTEKLTEGTTTKGATSEDSAPKHSALKDILPTEDTQESILPKNTTQPEASHGQADQKEGGAKNIKPLSSTQESKSFVEPNLPAESVQGTPVRSSPSLKSPQKPSPASTRTPTSLKSSQDAIVMPPPSLPVSAAKKRLSRAKTTIFEDHVPKSPSLSQQQASRKSALILDKAVLKPKGQAKPKKRRTIVQDDDEDDEDELSRQDAPDEEEKPAPKKRGRSSKTPVIEQRPKAKSKTKQKAIKDSEDEDSGDSDGEAVEEPEPESSETEEDERPKKKRPGRPPKAKPHKETTRKGPAPPNDAVKITSSDMAAIERSSNDSPAKAALQRKDPNPQTQMEDNQGAQIEEQTPTPAPPPLPPVEKTGGTFSKSSPVSHSPINKSQAGVSFRVGLSKKSRIPSLLKTFRPPPKASTR